MEERVTVVPDAAAWRAFRSTPFTSGGTEVAGPERADGWKAAIAEAKTALELPEHHLLTPWTVDLFLPADPAER